MEWSFFWQEVNMGIEEIFKVNYWQKPKLKFFEGGVKI